MKESNSKYLVKLKSQAGFSLIELFAVVAVIGIVATIAVIGVTRARTDTQFLNAARTLKSYIESGVSDAKRRHALGADRAKIEVLNTSSYRVTEDFNADGILEAQTVQLPSSASFVYAGSPPSVTIDLHGNVAEGQVLIALTGNGRTSQITVSSLGDAGMDENAPDMPAVTSTPTSVDIKTTVALPGSTPANLDPSPSPTPTPLPYCTGTQKPINDPCRCRTGQTIDSSGKCH